jgi:hypothetical protein
MDKELEKDEKTLLEPQDIYLLNLIATYKDKDDELKSSKLNTE